jgi:hypothetical protein
MSLQKLLLGYRQGFFEAGAVKIAHALAPSSYKTKRIAA